jgi:hypothetical protein
MATREGQNTTQAVDLSSVTARREYDRRYRAKTHQAYLDRMKRWRAGRRSTDFKIYLITNRVTQQKYVGMTKWSLNRRWYRHIEKANEGRTSLLHDAIRTWGSRVF